MKIKELLLSALALTVSWSVAEANEHTFVFDGENDLYGLKRQTTTDPNSLEFVQEISFTEAGIDFSLKKGSETGLGFALVNAGGTNAGILVCSTMSSSTTVTPDITLKVPGGKITAVKLYLSCANNAGLNSLNIDFNGAEVFSEKDGSMFYWAWSDEEGPETVSMKWENRYYARYLHSISVTYTEDLGGKEECGLAFAQSTAEGVLGQPFTAPELSNPHSLPLVWTSSDENVATVASDGTLTLVGCGKTIITVSTEGNEQYAAGNARYELTVIPAAANIAQMLALAPEVYDRVMVNFPMTVTFANGAYAFVIDAEGNAGYIENIRDQGSTSTTMRTIYKPGEIIPEGWIATNATIYASVIWQGIPAKVTESVEITYPEVEAVTTADTDRVVILKNVTFTTVTASGNTKAYGTTPDGTRYEFQDTYSTPTKPAGVYDVTCVVRYSKRGSTEYFYLAPIAYAEASGSGIETIESDAAEARYYNLQGLQVSEPKAGVFVKITGGKASKVIVR